MWRISSDSMTARKIAKKHIADLLNEWRQGFNVFVPSRDEGVAKWARWDGGDAEFLEWYRNTVVPPKALFFPPLEEMFSFHKDGDGYQVEQPPPAEERWLIFGIRPCDARALAVLDLNFKEGYEDLYYLKRRENGVLVGLGCTRPYESCFCTSLGIGPTDAADVDLMLTDVGAYFLVEAVTDRGEELLGKTSLVHAATGADEARAEEERKAAGARVTRKIDSQGISEKLRASFEDKGFWERVSAKCISCGICTFLCPTCYCFDISDELVKRHGARFRSWDSCAFSLYTKMPMENPRREKWRRLRQKVCHKYEFYPDSFDVIACTGCGRCIRLCPVNWDITWVLSSLPVQKQVGLET
jgi:sulfhydrogenase subunit beta (sulfur reductase)